MILNVSMFLLFIPSKMYRMTKFHLKCACVALSACILVCVWHSITKNKIGGASERKKTTWNKLKDMARVGRKLKTQGANEMGWEFAQPQSVEDVRLCLRFYYLGSNILLLFYCCISARKTNKHAVVVVVAVCCLLTKLLINAIETDERADRAAKRSDNNSEHRHSTEKWLRVAAAAAAVVLLFISGEDDLDVARPQQYVLFW